MDKEYIIHVAQTIGEQLLSLNPAPVIMSWGIEEFAVTTYRGIASTPHQGERTPAHRIRHRGTQRLRLLRGVPPERYESGMYQRGGVLRRAGRRNRPGYRERYRPSRVRQVLRPATRPVVKRTVA